MGKFFAITIVIIALASAVPIVRHTWAPPQNISVHGSAIDDQMSETMVEAGFSFLAAQFVLAVLVWKFSSRPRDAKVTKFPGGAKGLVIAALILVGSEILALGILGQKAWASVYFTPPAANAIPVQVQAGQFAFYFRYPGPDGKFGPLHPEKISEANANFYGLDTTHDQDSKDDIVTAEMAIPVNREIHLLMHSKDVGHSLYVPELDVSIHFTATKVGKYEIVCTQLCGLGHYNMKAYLEVKSQEDYDGWIKQQAALQ